MGSEAGTVSDEIMDLVGHITVPVAFLRTVAGRRDAVAPRLAGGRLGRSSWTWTEYADRVARAVAACRPSGCERGDRIVLMMRNIPEFHVFDLAAVFCGATPVSIYNSSSPDQIAATWSSTARPPSGSSRTRPTSAASSRCGVTCPTCAPWPCSTTLPVSHPTTRSTPARCSRRSRSTWPVWLGDAQPDDLATLIYTSGTTGPPKAVMITHRNIAWTVESLARCIDFETFAGQRLVSYLPMAHIAERMVSHYQAAFFGYDVTCCPEPGQASAYFRDVRPTLVFGVPRVWEKMHAGVTAALGADPEKGRQFAEAVAAALPIAEAGDEGRVTEEQEATWQFLDDVAFRAVRAMVGLDQCQLAITGAAPIPAEILRWYRAIGIPLPRSTGCPRTAGP